MRLLEPKCPASEVVRHATSPNVRGDSQCRIMGHLQPAEGSPCCGEYAECPLWQGEQDRVRFGVSREGGPPFTRNVRVVPPREVPL
jgi:hypothetical protein